MAFHITRINLDGSTTALPDITAPVDATGKASVESGLPEGVYRLAVSLVGNGYFQAEAVNVTPGVSALALTDGQGAARGAGWWGEAKVNTEFNLRPGSGKKAGLTDGQFKLRAGNLNLTVTQFDWLVANEQGARVV
ncbi:MAG TPA: hypothetical protein VD902_05120, partial [Symbiobacteriaceae bacterium]|nr:hypothetical protein [Symbiobacteriaceae bacterium]